MPEITAFRAQPALDRRRVQMYIEIDELVEPPPYLELHISDPDGADVAEMLVLGLIEGSIRVTLHLRPPALAGETRPYTARGRLFFGLEGQEEQTFSTAETTFYFPVD